LSNLQSTVPDEYLTVYETELTSFFEEQTDMADLDGVVGQVAEVPREMDSNWGFGKSSEYMIPRNCRVDTTPCGDPGIAVEVQHIVLGEIAV
jgi:hypothetical protein